MDMQPDAVDGSRGLVYNGSMNFTALKEKSI